MRMLCVHETDSDREKDRRYYTSSTPTTTRTVVGGEGTETERHIREEQLLASTICRDDFLHFPLHDVNKLLVCSQPANQRANLISRYRRHGRRRPWLLLPLRLLLLLRLPRFRRYLPVLLH